MTLSDYVKVFAKRWHLIAVIALVTALSTWVLSPATPVSTASSYTATATLLADTSGGLAIERIALFITQGEVPLGVADRIVHDGEDALLGAAVTVTPDTDSGSLSIASTEKTAGRAEEIANTFAEESVAFFAQGREETGSTELVILQPAVAVANDGGLHNVLPPGRWHRAELAALLGLLLGMALALVVERFDSRIGDRRQIQRALGMPIIAEIHRLRGKERRTASSIVSSRPTSAAADGYRAARTAIAHALGSKRTSAGEPSATPLILVTSANPGEGKTTSVANLALSFAESGKSVLVLDADFHSPDLHVAFDVVQGVGISDYISEPGAWSLESLVRPTNAHGVRILTAGTRLDHPATLASRTGALLEVARGMADVVLVDSAPVLATSDVFDISPSVDIAVVVARSGWLSEQEATRTVELLTRFEVPVCGAITIGSKSARGRRYGYGQSGSASNIGRSRRRGDPFPLGPDPDTTAKDDDTLDHDTRTEPSAAPKTEPSGTTRSARHDGGGRSGRHEETAGVGSRTSGTSS